VAYRLRNGVDHRRVEMAALVQQMVVPRASGVLFTADPVSGNRRVAVVEATMGLGDALVSGTVDADRYWVREEKVVDRTTTAEPVLADQEAWSSWPWDGRIESVLGCPQDIEWCLDDLGVQIVQSRPITTLFPIPEAADEGFHVYVSAATDR
jgi:pyruvate,water dikinase